MEMAEIDIIQFFPFRNGLKLILIPQRMDIFDALSGMSGVDVVTIGSVALFTGSRYIGFSLLEINKYQMC